MLNEEMAMWGGYLISSNSSAISFEYIENRFGRTKTFTNTSKISQNKYL